MSPHSRRPPGSGHERLALLAILDEQAGVTENDLDGRIIRVNARFEQLCGYGEAELLGQTFELLDSGVHNADFWEAIWQQLRAGQAWHGEICNRAKDGQLFWEDTVIAPVPGPDGQTLKYIAVRRDITPTKQAQAELQARRAELARVQHLAGVGGWTLDRGRQRLLLSDECRRLLGLPPGEDLDLNGAARLFRSADWNALRQAIREAAEHGQPFDRLLALRARNTAPRWFRAMGETDTAPGRAPQLVGALQEVTALTLAQRSAEANERTLRSAIEALDEPFALFDADEALVFCNERYRYLVGTQHGTVQPGMQYEDVVRLGMRNGGALPDTDDVEGWVQEQIALFRTRHSDQQNALRDGRWIRAINRGTADGMHVVFRIDVTESRRRIEAAGAAARSKSQFLANMSHEIRTPLNAVLGMLQLLGHTTLDAEQSDLLHKADGAARHLLGLLNDILDHSKAEAGKMTLEPLPLHLPHLLDELRVILSANIGSKPVALNLVLDPQVPHWLVADAMRLQQVLINLAGNALKFTERGEVRVEVRLVGLDDTTARLHFAVTDTGIGIAPEQREAIFAAFSQAEISTTRRFGGTGLGLSISQRLVHLMGGDLQLDSELGRGSCFHFELPLPLADAATVAGMAPRPAAAPGPSAAPGAPRLAGLRLLLAEDNALNREVARKLLGREGATVVCAEDGEQALAALDREPFDLVLMDMQMPHMDGLQATRQLRRDPRWATLPVLAMTANASAEDRNTCLAAGMNGHVGKPFNLDTLVALVLGLCGHAPLPGHRPDAPPPAWEDSAVLDDAGALARFGHDRNFYAGLLREFDPQARRLVDRLLQQGDRDAAHQLKSGAAAVGAYRLSALCAVLEAGREPSIAADDAKRLQAELDAVSRAVQGWLSTFDGAQHGAAALAPTLQALADSLHSQSLDCFDRFDALVAAHGEQLGAALDPLREAMAAFDTEAAETACRGLLFDLSQSKGLSAH
ncbi:ATP-binding protein [Roseateles sp. BYS87W]|uniref:histidine kinase n=1 Tax=Pelomonas baiyunensis TaxID=3299026 RepID=A0ABW7GU23_9BURK